jgi:hypothetical protein
MRYIKTNTSKYNISIDIDTIDFHNIHSLIDDYINMLKLTMTKRFNEALNDFINDNLTTNVTNIWPELKGIYAISSPICGKNPIARFSQNILYVSSCCKMIIKEQFIHSLFFNMILSSIEPGHYIYYKTNSINLICTLSPTDVISQQLSDVYLPSDVFFTRKSYPYMVSKDNAMSVTFRTGRPLHPLGQVSTRGCWNFLINNMNQFETSDLIDDDKFSVCIGSTHLYPESSVLSDRSFDNRDHWTKVKNVISVI